MVKIRPKHVAYLIELNTLKLLRLTEVYNIYCQLTIIQRDESHQNKLDRTLQQLVLTK
jgi:hypothetical protein